jgi:hypothetical protein
MSTGTTFILVSTFVMIACAGVDASRKADPATRLREAEAELARGVITAEDRARYSTNAARAALELREDRAARQHALNALEALKYSQRDWNYGNVVHHAHMVLGHVALANDDTDGAVTELWLAGETPGSPQLDTFGPNMSLALALLERGKRKAVLDYLGRCGRFWTKHDLLAQWTKVIEAGGLPDFGPNLRY